MDRTEIRPRITLRQLGDQWLREALSADDPLQCLERLTHALHRRFGLSICGLFLAGVEGHLRQETLAGPSVWAHQIGQRWQHQRGIVGRCFRTGAEQWVPDVRKDPDYVLADPGVLTEFAIPLKFNDEILGVLNLEAPSRDALTPRVRHQLRVLSSRLAGVIRLALLGYRLQAMSRQLEEANRRLARNARSLRRLATHDELTRVPNRRHFEDALESALNRYHRTGETFTLLLVDVDHFKAFNDRYGHHAGDRALAGLARAMKGALRRTDIIARYGGEEFAVLAGGCRAAEAEHLALRLMARVEKLSLAHAGTPSGRMSISIGLADTGAASDRDGIVKAADVALYRAKSLGRARCCVHEEPQGSSVTS